jgi:hypothetical protein
MDPKTLNDECPMMDDEGMMNAEARSTRISSLGHSALVRHPLSVIRHLTATNS